VRLFFDVNVVLDVLAAREPHLRASARVLAEVERGRAKGFVAAHGVTTIYYLLAKHLNRRRARAAVVQLLGLVRAAPVDHEVLLQALSLGWDDFEDAVQAAAALKAKATHLITRNPRDFAGLAMPVLTPEEFVQAD
jgi:predicted nucleic acid-binding protein